MKMPKFVVFVLAIVCQSLQISAQTDTAAISQKALSTANHLISAFRLSNWDQYLSITYPGVVQYYGGRQGFQDYVQRTRNLNKDIEDSPEHIQLIQMANDLTPEWQCVIRKTRESFVDGKKATIISYMIGQSKDDGNHWTYFDVALNSVENVVYIMPDIFDRLAIPQREIVYDKNLARVP